MFLNPVISLYVLLHIDLVLYTRRSIYPGSIPMHKKISLMCWSLIIPIVYFVSFDPTLKRSVAMTEKVITFGYCTDYFLDKITGNKKMQYDIW